MANTQVIAAIRMDDTGSVLLDTGTGLEVWMDISEDEDGEITADWNAYIFHKDNANDMAVQAFQEDCDNYMEASSTAIDYYEQNWRNTTTEV